MEGANERRGLFLWRFIPQASRVRIFLYTPCGQVHPGWGLCEPALTALASASASLHAVVCPGELSGLRVSVAELEGGPAGSELRTGPGHGLSARTAAVDGRKYDRTWAEPSAKPPNAKPPPTLERLQTKEWAGEAARGSYPRGSAAVTARAL